MAVIVHHFYSAALTECNSMTVIVPLERAPRNLYPVLWLIPPFGCDHTAWIRHTDVEQLAQQNAMMIVMPDMKLSFGTDMVHGLKYHTMLTDELPQVLAQVYPADLSRQMIAGAGEGAYAALYASLSCPGKYLHTFALSCGSLIDAELPAEFLTPLRNAFGTEQPTSLSGSKYDLCTQLKNTGHTGVWHLIWSDADRYRSSCQALSACLGDDESSEVHLPPLGWREWETILSDCFKSI